jgi:alpha-ketoglutarate-dependent taurine dioxygenase
MLWETTLSSADPAPGFADLRDAWKAADNKVFVMRGNGIAQPKEWYTDHFDQIGTPVPFAEDATAGDRDHQRSGEIWMEVRYDPTIPDAYRHSANPQPLHTDGSYIPDFPNATLMTCIANAGEGGETTFVHGDDVVAALRAEDPDLLQALTAGPMPHARSGDFRSDPVIDLSGDTVLLNWNYYCVDRDAPAEQKALADRFFDFLQSSPMIRAKTIEVKLSPGDAVTWKDREVLHGRNGFIATAASERFLWKCCIDVGRLAA